MTRFIKGAVATNHFVVQCHAKRYQGCHKKKHPLYSTQTKNLSCKLEENGRLSYMRVESYLNHIIITGYCDKIDGCLHTWKKVLYIILPAILHDLLVFTSITITYLPTQAPSEKACGHSLTTLGVRGIKVICFHQSPHTHTLMTFFDHSPWTIHTYVAIPKRSHRYNP